MSTLPHIISALPLAGLVNPTDQKPPRRPADMRKSNQVQSRALQAISHAIEHLVDSRLFDTWQSPSDAEAVHILMACSREVFQECEVISSWPQRVHHGIVQRLKTELSLSQRDA